ncbi:DUF6585 family protein [Ktedonospora formicarum]|uniref:Uncharacterized protein n=1 Tax=Ktedonospora formicarum TaxID=2778364 RepID=A0A8J3I7A9_9CHLR|nr:DUF6585 family protein [Ktedonospora formicarum]GHO48428.1 hypothetical protein KSX_65910 [Ktedonospora formicarum]
MAWQPQYPGQVNNPFTSPFGGTTPPAQIPPAVFQVAEAAGLGAPVREYNRGANTSNAGRSALQIPLLMGLIGGGIGLLVGIVVPLLVVPFPFNLVTAGVVLVVFLPFAPMLIRLTRGSFGGGGKHDFRAWACPGGLVYTQGGQFSALRWEDIAYVWRKAGILNGVPSILGYSVQPMNGPTFAFNLLTGPYAGLIDMVENSSGSMSISSGAGEISSSGGFVQISGYASLNAYAGLGELIEEQLLQRRLPQFLESFQQGGSLPFGKVTIYPQGLSDGNKNLSWHEIASVQVSPLAILITKQPANLPWFNLSTSELPNAPLFVGLLNTLRARQG